MTPDEEVYAEVAADAIGIESLNYAVSLLEVIALMRAAKIRLAADRLDDTRPKEAP